MKVQGVGLPEVSEWEERETEVAPGLQALCWAPEMCADKHHLISGQSTKGDW